MPRANAEIAQRLREFAGRFGGPSGLAKALGISAQQMTNYLSGRRIPGNKMQERLRQLGCDTILLITGSTVEEINKKHEKNVEQHFANTYPTRHAGLKAFEAQFGEISVQRVNEVAYFHDLGKGMQRMVADAPKVKYKARRMKR